MSLDAIVYCDCFEKGLLRVAPRTEWDAYIDESGARSRRESDWTLEEDLEFDQWAWNACEHERSILLHHYIGNMATVEFLRRVLSNQPKKVFPLVLSKIIYNGTHCCDFIGVDQVVLLKPELKALSGVHCDDAIEEGIVRHFEEQLGELIETSLRVDKPIVF